MSLSKRLFQVAAFVDQNAFIADVGSDHAELPIYLLKEKKISGAQAIENKPGPYSRMEEAVLESGYGSFCELSFSDGLADLSPKADTVIIAGMGGGLILSILKRHPEKLKKVKTLILDAHTDREKLRTALPFLGYQIVDECFLLEEGIAYDILKASRVDHARTYSILEAKYGPLNIERKPKSWLQALQEKRKRLLSFLEKEGIKENQRRKWQSEIEEIDGLTGEKRCNCL